MYSTEFYLFHVSNFLLCFGKLENSTSETKEPCRFTFTLVFGDQNMFSFVFSVFSIGELT